MPLSEQQTTQRTHPKPIGVEHIIVDGGEMGERMRQFAWHETSLGPVEHWPQSLRSAVSILLPSKAQICLFWGLDLIAIYNDAYRPTFGTKHPWALGRPARECWREVWDVLQPLFEGVVRTGEAFWASDHLFYLERHGFSEETYFDVSYDPVRDESGGVGGLFCIVSETTGRVLGERRLRTLRELGQEMGGKSDVEICGAAAAILAQNGADVPFSHFFLLDAAGRSARLVATTASDAKARPEQDTIDLASRTPAAVVVEELMRSGQAVETTPAAFACSVLPVPASEERALAIPLVAGTQPVGILVAGVSRHLAFGGPYRDYFDLVGSRVSAALSNQRAYEEERRRAEALAELDRAKTAFFSNVSHEFRTPLTLLLGPLEDALSERAERPARDVERLELMHRNALRLTKLVNTMLDFSRIEAGRVDVSYAPTDLVALTKEIASTFESTIARAGLRFRVQAPPLPEPVHVDADMWEKIVLNLLSNAFKFTFEGEIEVSLSWHGDHVELSVRDTGTGIPAEELPHVFQRFHRVPNARSRTHEGTGIGLALVHELVGLHAGHVAVESALGKGTTFRVSIPAGTTHLPAERVASARVRTTDAAQSAPFVEEASRWLPEMQEAVRADASGLDGRILVADDNADMRRYVCRVLGSQFDVTAVADGQAALEAAQHNEFDLVLTDVMMPGLDGFRLLQALRDNEATARTPVILLSARAGEEASSEGLEAGADDYIVKPFSARELLARVGTQVKVRRLGRTLEELLARERAARADADAASRAKDEFLAMLGHELRNPLAPILTALQLLKLRDDQSTKELTIIERQVRHLIRLVDDLLDISRITRGKVELRRDRLKLADIVAKAIEMVSPLLESRRHYVTVSIPKRGMQLEGDEARLIQVFTNLLTNAAKYTPPSGRIALSASRDGHEIVVQVKDSGIGISPELLPNVFDLFTQGTRSIDRADGGLGLGLAIVHSLVRLHGGSVAAISEGAGRGSEFVVRLPASEPGVSAARPGAAAERAPWSGVSTRLRMLVVDDNEDGAEILAELLGRAGHIVRVAHDGPQALELAETLEPDMAVLDIGLPVMDGYELAARLRARFPELRMIALTGYGQNHNRVRSREAGFSHHLVKPVNVEDLMEAIAAGEGRFAGGSEAS
jgi:signal transduction histidine kinase